MYIDLLGSFDANYLSYINNLPQWLKIIIIAYLGLVIGSYLNVVILRRPICEKNNLLPYEQTQTDAIQNKFAKKSCRSICLSCGEQLKWYHNIPILSFVVLRGKCAFCKKSISYQYPFVEFFNCAAYVGSFCFVFDKNISAAFVVWCFLISLSIIIAIIDFISKVIYDLHSSLYVFASLIFFDLAFDSYIGNHFMDSLVIFVGLIGAISIYVNMRNRITGSNLEMIGDGDLPLILIGIMATVGCVEKYGIAASSLYTLCILAIWFLTKLIRDSIVNDNFSSQHPAAPAILLSTTIFISTLVL